MNGKDVNERQQQDASLNNLSLAGKATGFSHRSTHISQSFRFKRSLILSAILGACTALAFSPFDLFFVAFITFGGLCWLWNRVDTPRQAALLGGTFGFGMFGTGISWLYISLHDFGGMPMPIAMFAVLCLCAYLALFPALTGWFAVKFARSSPWHFALAIAASWTFTEWLRGWLFTGFPWLAIGYSQVPWSPLASFAPIGGVYAISFITVLVSALAALISTWKTVWPRAPLVISSALTLLFLAAWSLKQIEWTTPANAPISVSLLQGNIPQELKFDPARLEQQLQTYLNLIRDNQARLIVTPESAIPLLKSDVPTEYWATLKTLTPPNGDILIGVFDDANEGRQIFNSMISIGKTPEQIYHKAHLVPFGEFIPLKWLFGWVYTSLLDMPLSDQTSGARFQRPLEMAGEKIAVNICYEDVFGEEIIRQLPEATLLVNVSNDAWFGERIAPWQHTQIAQTRALETGRFMLRATNTGVTSIINDRGKVIAALPQLTTAALRAKAQGRVGTTPYITTGNVPIISLCFILLAGFWFKKRSTPQ